MLGKILSETRSPFTAYSRLGLISRNDKILKRRGKTATRASEIYRDLLLDPVVLACFDKLVSEIMSRDWVVQGSTKKINKFVTDVLADLGNGDNVTKNGTVSGEPSRGLKSVVRHLATALITGMEVAECSWRLVEGQAIVSNLIPRDARRIGFSLTKDTNELEVRAIDRNDQIDGTPVVPRSLVLFRYWTHDNQDIYGAGLGAQLLDLVEARSMKLKDWRLYADKHVNPTAIATYPIGLQDEEIDNLQLAMQSLGERSSMTIPEGVSVDWLNSDGKAEVFSEILAYVDKQISMLMCGEESVGSAGDGGSRSRDQVADSVRVRRAKQLADEIVTLLNQTLVKWLVELNFGEKAEVPTLSFDFSDLEQQLTGEQALQYAKDLSQLGYEVPQSVLESALGFKIEKAQEALQLEESPAEPELSETPTEEPEA